MYHRYIILGLVLWAPFSVGAVDWAALDPTRLFGGGEQQSVGWSYRGDTGPEKWADLSPAFAACRDGQAQSPVDLQPTRTVRFEPLHFSYRSQPLTMVNENGAIRLQFKPGSRMITAGAEYHLIEGYFRVPGEHALFGQRAHMELQLIHRDAAGRVAVVAIPMNAGRRPNSMLKRVWDMLPEPGREVRRGRMGINPIFLLPQRREYLSYIGSLSQPPCTEGVTWFVFREPLEVDAAYVTRLKLLTGTNARPLQPLNGRDVLWFER